MTLNRRETKRRRPLQNSYENYLGQYVPFQKSTEFWSNRRSSLFIKSTSLGWNILPVWYNYIFLLSCIFFYSSCISFLFWYIFFFSFSIYFVFGLLIRHLPVKRLIVRQSSSRLHVEKLHINAHRVWNGAVMDIKTNKLVESRKRSSV